MEEHQHPEYARVVDLSDAITMIGYVEDNHNSDIRRLRDEISAVKSTIRYSELLAELKERVGSIEAALIEIQDSLRRLGMDDMSDRLGNLDQLLA